ATCEIAAGDASKGVTALEDLRSRDSANPALLYLLGTGYLKTKRRDDAKHAFDELFASAPPAVASLAMCKAYYRSGLLDEAERERARALNPAFWGNYFYLGRAKLQQGAAPDAVTLLEHAAELNPSESSVYYQLGRAYSAAGQPERAKHAMARVRELKAKE